MQLMRIALVVPHIFMQAKLLSKVIFSPGQLALWLARQLKADGVEVTLFSPGKLILPQDVSNINADLSLFEQELAQRGDDYIDLLKKHPLTFITLARQVQSALVAKAYQQANQDKFDLVHVWCNEEELALVMAKFCHKPVVFTHHEPFNFLVRYRSMFAKYAHLNWISLSQAQQKTLQAQLGQEKTANFIANVYHGLPKNYFQFCPQPAKGQAAYFLYMGRIIQPKGVHLAIKAAKQAGVKLKIAGKHYAGFAKDKYWQKEIKPQIDGQQIQYLGFINKKQEKQKLLAQATALLMPSIWEEPFGLVMIEALACGTPVIGFKHGAIPEIIESGYNGELVDGQEELAQAMQKSAQQNIVKRQNCRASFEEQFSLEKMAKGYKRVYESLFSKTSIN